MCVCVCVRERERESVCVREIERERERVDLHWWAASRSCSWVHPARRPVLRFGFGAALETTQGQIDGFFSHLTFKCYLLEVASVGD